MLSTQQNGKNALIVFMRLLCCFLFVCEGNWDISWPRLYGLSACKKDAQNTCGDVVKSHGPAASMCHD